MALGSDIQYRLRDLNFASIVSHFFFPFVVIIFH
jgi:hypothetical protein